jgi:hypothetical protein
LSLAFAVNRKLRNVYLRLKGIFKKTSNSPIKNLPSKDEISELAVIKKGSK